MVLYTDRTAAIDRDHGRVETVTRTTRFTRRRRLPPVARATPDASVWPSSGRDETVPAPAEVVTRLDVDRSVHSDSPAAVDDREAVGAVDGGASGIADVAVSGLWGVSSSVHDHVGRLCASGAKLVLVDVGGVSSVTPSGMADLMHAVRSARRFRADLRIYGHSPAVADALDALELGKILVLYSERNAALICDRRVPDTRSRGLRLMRTGKRSRSEGSN